MGVTTRKRERNSDKGKTRFCPVHYTEANEEMTRITWFGWENWYKSWILDQINLYVLKAGCIGSLKWRYSYFSSRWEFLFVADATHEVNFYMKIGSKFPLHVPSSHPRHLRVLLFRTIRALHSPALCWLSISSTEGRRFHSPLRVKLYYHHQNNKHEW